MTNVFNTLNITNVYRATGNAGDDGYLNAARFQTSISTQNNEEVFRYYYAMKANNCLLYTSPSPRDAHESRMPSSA